ncbi:MAG TPA: 50S ribosomal protein L34e, partial [Candidatus Nanoarchaeia archaeon]|nr:50S ribosomal protein L34e [Candidatus Nanoarchaeia archaeon]
MVAPKHRSRTFRRVFRRTPGGRLVLHYHRRKPGMPQCGSCGASLPGVVRGRKAAVKAVPRSARRPERPYGGQFCSKCMRQI